MERLNCRIGVKPLFLAITTLDSCIMSVVCSFLTKCAYFATELCPCEPLNVRTSTIQN